MWTWIVSFNAFLCFLTIQAFTVQTYLDEGSPNQYHIAADDTWLYISEAYWIKRRLISGKHCITL